MTYQDQEPKYHGSNVLGVLAGLFIGAIAGAVTMLLLAPQSGKDTRIQIQKKGVELRGRTTEIVDEAMAQVRSSVNKVTIGGREKFQELKQHGQEMAVEQLDRVAEAAQAGKKALQGSQAS